MGRTGFPADDGSTTNLEAAHNALREMVIGKPAVLSQSATEDYVKRQEEKKVHRDKKGKKKELPVDEDEIKLMKIIRRNLKKDSPFEKVRAVCQLVVKNPRPDKVGKVLVITSSKQKGQRMGIRRGTYSVGKDGNPSNFVWKDIISFNHLKKVSVADVLRPPTTADGNRDIEFVMFHNYRSYDLQTEISNSENPDMRYERVRKWGKPGLLDRDEWTSLDGLKSYIGYPTEEVTAVTSNNEVQKEMIPKITPDEDLKGKWRWTTDWIPGEVNEQMEWVDCRYSVNFSGYEWVDEENWDTLVRRVRWLRKRTRDIAAAVLDEESEEGSLKMPDIGAYTLDAILHDDIGCRHFRQYLFQSNKRNTTSRNAYYLDLYRDVIDYLQNYDPSLPPVMYEDPIRISQHFDAKATSIVDAYLREKSPKKPPFLDKTLTDELCDPRKDISDKRNDFLQLKNLLLKEMLPNAYSHFIEDEQYDKFVTEKMHRFEDVIEDPLGWYYLYKWAEIPMTQSEFETEFGIDLQGFLVYWTKLREFRHRYWKDGCVDAAKNFMQKRKGDDADEKKKVPFDYDYGDDDDWDREDGSNPQPSREGSPDYGTKFEEMQRLKDEAGSLLVKLQMMPLSESVKTDADKKVNDESINEKAFDLVIDEILQIFEIYVFPQFKSSFFYKKLLESKIEFKKRPLDKERFQIYYFPGGNRIEERTMYLEAVDIEERNMFLRALLLLYKQRLHLDLLAELDIQNLDRKTNTELFLGTYRIDGSLIGGDAVVEEEEEETLVIDQEEARQLDAIQQLVQDGNIDEFITKLQSQNERIETETIISMLRMDQNSSIMEKKFDKLRLKLGDMQKWLLDKEFSDDLEIMQKDIRGIQMKKLALEQQSKNLDSLTKFIDDAINRVEMKKEFKNCFDCYDQMLDEDINNLTNWIIPGIVVPYCVCGLAFLDEDELQLHFCEEMATSSKVDPIVPSSTTTSSKESSIVRHRADEAATFRGDISLLSAVAELAKRLTSHFNDELAAVQEIKAQNIELRDMFCERSLGYFGTKFTDVAEKFSDWLNMWTPGRYSNEELGGAMSDVTLDFIVHQFDHPGMFADEDDRFFEFRKADGDLRLLFEAVMKVDDEGTVQNLRSSYTNIMKNNVYIPHLKRIWNDCIKNIDKSPINNHSDFLLSSFEPQLLSGPTIDTWTYGKAFERFFTVFVPIVQAEERMMNRFFQTNPKSSETSLHILSPKDIFEKMNEMFDFIYPLLAAFVSDAYNADPFHLLSLNEILGRVMETARGKLEMELRRSKRDSLVASGLSKENVALEMKKKFVVPNEADRCISYLCASSTGQKDKDDSISNSILYRLQELLLSKVKLYNRRLEENIVKTVVTPHKRHVILHEFKSLPLFIVRACKFLPYHTWELASPMFDAVLNSLFNQLRYVAEGFKDPADAEKYTNLVVSENMAKIVEELNYDHNNKDLDPGIFSNSVILRRVKEAQHEYGERSIQYVTWHLDCRFMEIRRYFDEIRYLLHGLKPEDVRVHKSKKLFTEFKKKYMVRRAIAIGLRYVCKRMAKHLDPKFPEYRPIFERNWLKLEEVLSTDYLMYEEIVAKCYDVDDHLPLSHAQICDIITVIRKEALDPKLRVFHDHPPVGVAKALGAKGAITYQTLYANALKQREEHLIEIQKKMEADELARQEQAEAAARAERLRREEEARLEEEARMEEETRLERMRAAAKEQEELNLKAVEADANADDEDDDDNQGKA